MDGEGHESLTARVSACGEGRGAPACSWMRGRRTATDTRSASARGPGRWCSARRRQGHVRRMSTKCLPTTTMMRRRQRRPDRRRGVRWRRQHLVAGVGAPADVDARSGGRAWRSQRWFSMSNPFSPHAHVSRDGVLPTGGLQDAREKLGQVCSQHNGASNANGTWSDGLDHEQRGAWSTPKESYRFSKPVGLLWSVYHVSLTFELFANRSGAADSA